MAKAIKWQIPFASLSGTLYRIDIYAEGYSGDPIQLTAGESPFVTEEDSSEDFFAPIRTQTGSIQVCTRKPDGTMLTLDEILPANNIDHPVRLINLLNSNAIEWQGFLSCEAYSQNYTAIPENLTLSVISVMEAMDSVEVELSESMAFKTVLGHICYAMRAIQTQSGMTLFNQMFLSNYCKNAMESTFFYNNVYFNTEEQISGDNITVKVHSISCKAILEQVAQFFGGCWREAGQNIYLEAVGKDSAFNFQSFATIATCYVDGGSSFTWITSSIVSDGISGFDWRGTDHKRDIRQGAKRVKVTAKLKEFECKMSLEECPVNNLVENPSARQSTWGEVHCNTNETFYSVAEHKHIYSKLTVPSGSFEDAKPYIEVVSYPSGINYSNTAPWSDKAIKTRYKEYIQNHSIYGYDYLYLTSYMGYIRNADNELQSGLMICGAPRRFQTGDSYVVPMTWYNQSTSNFLFHQYTPLILRANKGKLTLKMEMAAVYSDWRRELQSRFKNFSQYVGITMAICIGNNWLSKSGDTFSWQSSFTTFYVQNKEGKFEYEIPISSQLTGQVHLYIFPITYGQYHEYEDYHAVFDVFISQLELTYEAPSEELRTDRSENVYATETSQAFRDELSVDCELASYANNTKLATMIWNDSTTPAKLISLGGATVRPEADLLNRLATYYGAARQRLELEVAHITTPLPNLKLNGIGDGKVYLPLAESRDWREETCTLTCFETSETPSES